jgi:hypothetical protein
MMQVWWHAVRLVYNSLLPTWEYSQLFELASLQALCELTRIPRDY